MHNEVLKICCCIMISYSSCNGMKCNAVFSTITDVQFIFCRKICLKIYIKDNEHEDNVPKIMVVG